MFAFGAVLYEMLTGQPVFAGETVAEILAAVLKAEPDWNRLPADTPPGIRRLLWRFLRKDRNRRLDTAVAARIEIEEAGTEPGAEPVTSRNRERLAWLVAAILLLTNH
ncbi:MAG TPA: hypothetical protein VER98_10505 [Terriglobia bacterium]|nr:hypothetical protein [Terriglobia bacterium]